MLQFRRHVSSIQFQSARLEQKSFIYTFNSDWSCWIPQWQKKMSNIGIGAESDAVAGIHEPNEHTHHVNYFVMNTHKSQVDELNLFQP
mmetsp:Transcript_28234/g.37582  ORF Transcript_28234/g.37582 Transcript_28234/m.37582 type:complete len:88 (+) Transcript_28234:570-833(+)